MSDPTSIPTAPEQPTPLNYAVGSPDPQSGGVRPLGLILTLLGGLAAAVVAALVAFFWIIFRLPSPFFAPLIVQGLLVGGALFWLFKRFRLRGSAVGLLLGIICGLASPLSFQYGLYVRNVYHVHTTTVRDIEDARRTGNLGINVAYADWLEQHPFVAFDRLVLRPHGLHGFIGYLRLRGPKTATFGVIQALVVASLATFMGRKAATRRVCVQCQNWLGDAIEVAALP
ncbi:MAG: hypothetical protein JWM97_1109, partial [Phycisphaerales bacterium]|nr:hypothetical protein [Phycisphaerales bacterium]